MVKVKKNKVFKTHNATKKLQPYKIISAILSPSQYLGTKKDAILTNFNDFVINYKEEDFEKIFKILLKNEDIRNDLNQYSNFSECFHKGIFEGDFNLERLLSIYKVILLDNVEIIKSFDLLQTDIERCIYLSDFVEAKKLLMAFKEIHGNSIWVINTLFYICSLQNNYDDLNLLLNEFKEDNSSELYQMILDVTYRRVRGADAKSVVEETTLKMNEELVAGGAVFFAALCSLLFLPYPLYDDVVTLECVSYLQPFPLVDLYFFLSELLSHVSAEVASDNDEDKLDAVLKLIPVFNELNKFVKCERLTKLCENASKNLTAEKDNFSNVLIDDDVNHYDLGKYEQIIIGLELNKTYTFNSIAKANLYAKSYLYEGKNPTPELPFLLGFMIKNLINIYSLNNCEHAISQLISMSIKLNNTEYSRQILICLRNAYPKVLNDKKFNKLKYMLTSCTTPMSLSNQEPVLFYNSSYLSRCATSFSNLKARIASLIISNDSSGELEVLLQEFENKTLIRKDYIELKHAYLFRQDKFEELVIFASSELMDNSEAIISFNIEPIAVYINDTQDSSIEAVIFSYFYMLTNGREIDRILNEAFEEYILNEGGGRPSEIIESKDELTESEIMVFKNISNVNVMDYLGLFTNTVDLKTERLKIISLLRKFTYIDEEEYSSEYKQIIDDIVVESGVAKFSHSKVDIDLASLFEVNKQAIINTITSYQKSLDADETEDQYFSNDDLSEEGNGFVKGRKNELAVKLYETLYRDFLKNEGYGLDNNLSAEIRHSFFSNQMCSNLQDGFLLTDIDLEGNYESNIHWRECYHYIRVDILDEIDSSFMAFSRDFNSLIEKAESWMKVSVTPLPNVVFSFSELKIEDFENIKGALKDSSSPSGVSDVIFKILISGLEDCLVEMRHKLNEDFLMEADDLFNRLVSEINVAKHGAVLNDLFNSISIAKEGMKEDIKTVCEWFSLKSSKFVESYPLENVVQIAQTCLYKSFSKESQVCVLDNNDAKVDGSFVSAVVFSLINCFHNAMKYGIKKGDINVSFKSHADNSYSIYITNIVPKSVLQKLRAGRFDIICQKLRDMDSTELLAEEGNSGLYKAKHQLITASSNFNLTPNLLENEFSVEIKYNEKNTDR
jgi:hypothetical protein